MSDEVYRGVNKYRDFTTGEDLLKYTKTYNEPGKAKAQATRWRNQTSWIGNKNQLKPSPPKGTYFLSKSDYYSIFEWVDTWTERATEWEKV